MSIIEHYMTWAVHALRSPDEAVALWEWMQSDFDHWVNRGWAVARMAWEQERMA